jgi:hypothetical protein
MSTSILEQEYKEPNRPISQSELHFNKCNLFRKLHIGKVRAYHKCNHFYFVKENGRKEKEIMETDNLDVGNCSVCWKLNKTDRKLKTKARSLIDAYSRNFYEYPDFLSYDKADLELIYYKWLYDENSFV